MAPCPVMRRAHLAMAALDDLDAGRRIGADIGLRIGPRVEIAHDHDARRSMDHFGRKPGRVGCTGCDGLAVAGDLVERIVLPDPRHVAPGRVGHGEAGIAHPALERHQILQTLPDRKRPHTLFGRRHASPRRARVLVYPGRDQPVGNDADEGDDETGDEAAPGIRLCQRLEDSPGPGRACRSWRR